MNKIVLANGCFDPPHYGHIQHLCAAADLGAYLVVALTDDDTVRREKGKGRPLYTWVERAGILRELRCVDMVIRCASAAATIARIKPDIFVKGIDYATTGLAPEVSDACASVGAEIRYTDTPKLSASEITVRLRALAP